jgi:hypothetical protein
MSAATHILKTRVTAETKQIVESIARQQQLTESAWLRQLITSTLQSAGCRRLQQAHEFRPEKRRNSPSPNTNATLCRA